MHNNYILHLGDNLVTLKSYPDNHFDSIVTDPPYGIEFLGKDWDSHTGTLELYKECLRVLKPGGYMLAFSAARTYHQLASNIELAGFEIRDQLMWLYSSGFPKAQDIGKAIQKRLGVVEKDVRLLKQYGGIQNESKNREAGVADTDETLGLERHTTITQPVCTSPLAKEWEGYKTALKPAHEPVVMARKPFKGSTIDNVLKNGLGALNIDATRVPWGTDDDPEAYAEWMRKYPASTGSKAVFNNVLASAKEVDYVKDADAELNTNRDIDSRLQGRYPSNVIGEVDDNIQKYFINPQDTIEEIEQDYKRFYYCPKVSRKERHVGFDNGYRLSDNVDAKIVDQIKDLLK
jgi:site-specific DNA-methyltransferase (adenine-specific)